MNLSDIITQFIINELENQGVCEIGRNQLACKFNCSPSQINYVLSTRFSSEQGYIVESKQGGGGYVRVIKLPLLREKDFIRLMQRNIGSHVSEQAGEGLVKRLHEEGFLTYREMGLMKNIIRRETLNVELPERDGLRARILKAMIASLMREEFKKR